MSTKLVLTLMVSVFMLALTTNVPAFAQESGQSGQSATEKMRQAGESAESAASNAYHGAKTAVKDRTITAKVKAALHDDKQMEIAGHGIHVSTTAGVVTLKGEVPNKEAAERATELARQTAGVKRVNNELTVMTRGSSRTMTQ